jgi:folate-binding protein YgfZ
VTPSVARRDALLVRGPDAESFLQGQLSQDVAAIAVGASAWSFVLQPQGKVDALVRVTHLDGDAWRLDVDAGWGDAVKARLERFKLRVKVEIEADADSVEPLYPDDGARIEAGWPAMGAELTDRTIPAETGLVDRAVSFTKGCFTGQELVARIDSRGGNVPRHLRGVRIPDAGARPAVGADVVVGDKTVGTITSVAGARALAYIGRDIAPPVDATVRWEGGATDARIETLPFA